MGRVTARQRDRLNELIGYTEVMNSLTPREDKMVNAALDPDASFAEASKALAILRDKRDELRLEAGGVEPIETPENTFTTRLFNVAKTRSQYEEARAVAETLAAVVHQIRDEDECDACGHKHRGFDCVATSSFVEEDDWGDVKNAGCGCRLFVQPEDEQVLAYEAVQYSNSLSTVWKEAQDAVLEAMPGDLFVIKGSPAHHDNTEGVFLRAEATHRGVAYLLRIPVYGKDVFVPDKYLSRPGSLNHEHRATQHIKSREYKPSGGYDYVTVSS